MTALTEQYESLDTHHQHVSELRQHIIEGLSGLDYYLNQAGPHLPHVLNIGFPGKLNEQLLMQLDLALLFLAVLHVRQVLSKIAMF